MYMYLAACAVHVQCIANKHVHVLGSMRCTCTCTCTYIVHMEPYPYGTIITSSLSLQPVVSVEEREWGLSFVPPSQELHVLFSPVSSLSFSQFTATLSGSLTCIGQCLPYLPLYQSGPKHIVYMTRGSSFFLGKVTALGVLCCFALLFA